jgi:hypothetical protein
MLPLPAFTQQLWQASNLTQLAASQGNTAQLAFQVEVPALGHAVYRVHAAAAADARPKPTASSTGGSSRAGSSSSSSRTVVGPGDVTLTNGVLEMTVSAEEGGITTVKLLDSSSSDGGSSSNSSSGGLYSYSSRLVVYAVGGLFDAAGAYVFSARKQSQVGWWYDGDSVERQR